MLMLLPDFPPMRMSFRLGSTMRGNLRRVHMIQENENKKRWDLTHIWGYCLNRKLPFLVNIGL